MSKSREQTIFREPKYALWPRLLESKTKCLSVRQEIRNQIIKQAGTFFQRKKTALLSLPDTELKKLSLRAYEMLEKQQLTDETRLIVLGHQPVAYHYGLLRKQLDVVNVAREKNALSLNIIIDTDVGKAGEFVYPVTDDRTKIRRATLCFTRQEKESELFSSALVREDSIQILEILKSSPYVAKDFIGILQEVLEISTGKNWLICNSLIRELCTPESISLEVPFSEVCLLPAVRNFFSMLLRDPDKLFEAYNQALDSYRLKEKIKNAANPFPNLKGAGDERELPFWLIRNSQRTALTIADMQSSKNEDLLVPRGACITLLFRSVLADLFVHGRGGGSYDQFLPILTQHLIVVGILPIFDVCPRAISTETRLFFEKEANEISRLEILENNKKEIIAKTEIYKDLLPEDLYASIRPVLSERTDLQQRLRTTEDKNALLHDLNVANQKVRMQIEPWLAEVTKPLYEVSEEYKKTVLERSYPVWIF